MVILDRDKKWPYIAQMTANARAMFKYYGLPDLDLTYALIDKTFFFRRPEFVQKLDKLVPKDFETWAFNRNHGVTAVQGWRERRMCYSAQIIEHSWGGIEVDFDYFNPNYGILPVLGHLLECLTPGKTNSFKVAKNLRKRGIKTPDVREL